MKHFLTTQINNNGEPKANTINFIEETCLILRKFFKIMNNKMVLVPANILAFLGEITQLPCLSNQTSFLKSTFFEDISFLAEFFNEANNKTQRKFHIEAENSDDPLYSLMDIYNQGVQLALSNFEGNDPIIIDEFLNKCKPNFLWLVIQSNIWYLLKESYSDEPFVVQ